MISYDKNFLRKYEKAREEKGSILCAGFDPAIPRQREKNVISPSYFEGAKTDEEAVLAFFEDFIESVHDHCCAIKPNNQYIFHLSFHAYKKINKMIHSHGLISILDQKIGDIGSTNESGFFWMSEMGFDAVTYSPFAGNIRESLDNAHKFGLGLITLTLMSNPDAVYFMKNAIIRGLKGYEFIANELRKNDGDGMVVGATGHVTEEDLRIIRQKAGEEIVMLVPGIGQQEGDLQKVIVHGGKNILLNVGRAILYSEDIAATAKKYHDRFNEVRKSL